MVVDSDPINLAEQVTVLLVASEIIFTASLWLLGRPFYEAIKQRLILLWRKMTGSQPAP